VELAVSPLISAALFLPRCGRRIPMPSSGLNHLIRIIPGVAPGGRAELSSITGPTADQW
jgi:hypothetical protein